MAMLGGAVNKELATGQLHFQPPSFVKIQQETPKPETMLTEGHTLWYYVPHKNQAYRYPCPEFVQLLSDIFQGLRDVEERFDIILSGISGDGGYELNLTPNPPWPDIQHFKLIVSQMDYTIQRVEIYDSVGGITRFILGDLQVEDSFPKGFFRFSVPEGVDVIEEES
jgi:outer membrane lipoprotein-sorting protein